MIETGNRRCRSNGSQYSGLSFYRSTEGRRPAPRFTRSTDRLALDVFCRQSGWGYERQKRTLRFRTIRYVSPPHPLNCWTTLRAHGVWGDETVSLRQTDVGRGSWDISLRNMRQRGEIVRQLPCVVSLTHVDGTFANLSYSNCPTSNHARCVPHVVQVAHRLLVGVHSKRLAPQVLFPWVNR